jgi:two-component system sensor histidine kinase MprB
MSLRRRLMLMAVIAVGATVLVASAITWVAMRGQLRHEVDKGLMAQEQAIETLGSGQGASGPGGPSTRPGGAIPNGTPPTAAQQAEGDSGLDLPSPPRRGGRPDYAQEITAGGAITSRQGDDPDDQIKVTTADLAVARHTKNRFLSDRTRGGEHIRVLTIPAGETGNAFMLARSLEGTDSVLSKMLWVLLLICVGATALAFVAARLLARGVLKPVAELTDAAEHIEATGDLTRRVPVAGDDEVGRLASRFNAMLDRLGESITAQRQLVADVSHELRTPVTALRTNAEVLKESPRMPAKQRGQVLDDIVVQTEELSDIVGDVIELARGDVLGAEPQIDRDDLDFKEVVAESVERAQRHSPGIEFKTRLAKTPVKGDAQRLYRAVNNLLDNAAKYGGEQGSVQVTLQKGVLTVRDHGPGISGEELPRVTERFYRGSAAREHHGSGLGLAIVQQVAVAHGGKATIANAKGGGTVVSLSLPVSN